MALCATQKEGVSEASGVGGGDVRATVADENGPAEV